jgi:hypothetical protein
MENRLQIHCKWNHISRLTFLKYTSELIRLPSSSSKKYTWEHNQISCVTFPKICTWMEPNFPPHLPKNILMSEIESTSHYLSIKFPPVNGIEFPITRPLYQVMFSHDIHIIAKTARPDISIIPDVCASVHTTAPQCNYHAWLERQTLCYVHYIVGVISFES